MWSVHVCLRVHVRLVTVFNNLSQAFYITKTCLLKNILKILPPKSENFQMKNADIFHISVQNIDCRYSLEPPRRGGSNEYPQSMLLSRNKKK